eukprot:COSAG02_NODE_20229_length_842_cov_0.982503_2_plen_116_part_01
MICVFSDSLFMWLQADRQWQWQHTPPPSGSLVTSLPMDGLASLPPSINADLTVAVVALDGKSLNATKSRRFMRHPPPSATAAVEAMSVDHNSRQITANGSRFIGTGWFVDGHRPLA